MTTPPPPVEHPRLDSLAPRLMWAGGIVGLVGLGSAAALGFAVEGGERRLFFSWLLSLSYFLSLSLGALFFVLLQHLTRAGWSVVIRRIAEGLAGNFLLLALLAVPLLLGLDRLYPWARGEGVAHAAGKGAYLSAPFFIGRILVYFLLWGALGRFFLSTSVRQDETGEPGLTLRMQRVAAPGMIALAVTTTFAAFDLLMSLDPAWSSTIFGVYFFSGCMVGFFALLPVLVFLLRRTGRLTSSVTMEHYHDMGKLLFAFVVFWAYIAFSQYMLLWYANVPEETIWYARRQADGWGWVGLVLLFGHFVGPFLFLLSRFPKRREELLVSAGVWMLAMHAMDLYWLIMPEMGPGSVAPRMVDVACLVGTGGLFLAGTARALRSCNLVPRGDPRLSESLAFENA